MREGRRWVGKRGERVVGDGGAKRVDGERGERVGGNSIGGKVRKRIGGETWRRRALMGKVEKGEGV